MKHYDWDELKNSRLKAERRVSFEDVLAAIDDNRLLDDLEHPNKGRYPGQRELVINLDDYVYLVPYVEDDEKIFLKTIIPSRKATKQYLKGDKS